MTQPGSYNNLLWYSIQAYYQQLTNPYDLPGRGNAEALDYCARLKNAKSCTPLTPAPYWDYVPGIGATEGNLNFMWSAREYHSGIKHLVSMLRRREIFLLFQDRCVAGYSHYNVPPHDDLEE